MKNKKLTGRYICVACNNNTRKVYPVNNKTYCDKCFKKGKYESGRRN